MLECALRYLKAGYSVVPCLNNKKSPSLPSWEEFQKRLPTEEEVIRWWTDKPNANIGIITGRISNLFVIDIDSEKGREEFLNIVGDEYKKVKTPTSRTPRGGSHRFHTNPTNSYFYNHVNIPMGIDVRSNGGLVLVPPSYLDDGVIKGGYEWGPGFSLFDLAPVPPPDKYLEYVKKRRVMNGSAVGDMTGPNLVSLETSIYNINNKLSNNKQESEKLSLDCKLSTKCEDKIFPTLSSDFPQDSQDSQLSLEDSAYLFSKGNRDNTLFHYANLLVKAGATQDEVEQGILRLNSTLNPPLPVREALAKVKSAIKRGVAIHGESQEGTGRPQAPRDIVQEVVQWVQGTKGSFSLRDVYYALDVQDKAARKVVSNVLGRLVEERVVERYGSRNGHFRKIDSEIEDINYKTPATDDLDIMLPMNLNSYVKIYPGNIIVVAGSPNSGKTAFMLNIAYLNIPKHKINYFNSEMGGAELNARISNFPETLDYWDANFLPKARSGNFADVIDPYGINLIDFLEIYDNFWLIGQELRKIHDVLKTGVALVAIQKESGSDRGRGGDFGVEKPRLYLTIDSGLMKIRKCKNYKNPLINPNGLQCYFKLVDGCKFVPVKDSEGGDGWFRPKE